MADGKWIEGLTADTPLEEAARKVLGVRLRLVAEWLPRAVDEAERDVEHVHQLRVSTRRADAALRIFAGVLPRRAYREARRRLRTLRRAAGAARDWDVFLGALGERREGAAEAEGPGLDFLIGYSLGQRDAAQAALAAADAAEGGGFGMVTSATTAAVRRPDSSDPQTMGGLARPLLATLLRELHRAASGDLTDYEHLHRVRILGKRLRYAMEVFADCFGPGFREGLYPRVEEMQEVLGRANDSHVAGQRLAALRQRLRARWPAEWERLKPGVEGLLRFHQRRLPQERRRFLRWWEEWQRQGVEKGIEAGGP
jgi:CHAD domain-containing protein